MASKFSPEVQASPILIATIAAAGVLLLLEAIHHLPNIVASFERRPQSVFIALAVLAVALILSERSRSGIPSERASDESRKRESA